MIINIILVISGLAAGAAMSFYVVRRILRTTPRNSGNSTAAFQIGGLFNSASSASQTPEEQASIFERWKDRFFYASFPRKLFFVTLCSMNFTITSILSSKQQPVPLYLDMYTPIAIFVICLLWGITLVALPRCRSPGERHDFTLLASTGWWACFLIELVAMLAVAFHV